MGALIRLLVLLTLCGHQYFASLFDQSVLGAWLNLFSKGIKKLHWAYVNHTHTYIIINGNSFGPNIKLTIGVTLLHTEYGRQA